MKRSRWVLIVVPVLIALIWTGWIGYVNTRTTRLSVQVASHLERVTFYSVAEPARVVAEIRPQGQAVEMLVVLRNTRPGSFFTQGAPAQYYFVTEVAGEQYQSPAICCETGFADRSEALFIRGLKEWEKPGP